MSINRRDFLKGLGLCAVVGTAASTGFTLAGPAHASSGGGGHEQAADDSGSTVRWGMVIDIMRFSEENMDRAQAACHEAHNVPLFDNVKDEIKWIWKTGYTNAFTSKSHQFLSEDLEKHPVTVQCNHCANPPCVRVCPTKATFKLPNGITQMDFHRCIGCRFCMAGCPYGSRSFNWRDPRKHIAKINMNFPTRERGVVEKCNFCMERIAKGPVPESGQELSPLQLPLCVRESGGAMIFGNLKDPQSKIRRILNSTHVIQRKPEAGTNPSVFYII